MEKHAKSDAEITLIGFTGAFFSALAGYLLYGSEIFNAGHPAFQFISFGILGAAIFTLLNQRYYKTLFLTVAILLVLNLMLTLPNSPLPMLAHLLFFAGVTGVVVLYTLMIHPKITRAALLRPLILAVIMMAAYLLISLILNQLYTVNQYPYKAATTMPIGFLLGLGLGAGWQMAERIEELNQPKRKR